jgi:hypothetical protein
MRTLLTMLKGASLASVLAGSLALGAGCGGGGATFQSTGNQTLGRELQDLQESYDKGIITKKEYEDTKKRLIKKHTQY